MAIYEVLSEQVPFAPLEGPDIIFAVVDGERPGRPQGREGAWFSDGLWWMLEDCWKPQPDHRPNLDIVLACLEEQGDASKSVISLALTRSLIPMALSSTVLTLPSLRRLQTSSQEMRS